MLLLISLYHSALETGAGCTLGQEKEDFGVGVKNLMSTGLSYLFCTKRIGQ